jgi:hypothetical protein
MTRLIAFLTVTLLLAACGAKPMASLPGPPADAPPSSGILTGDGQAVLYQR